jgi:biopolymer transport protein ExbB
MMIEAMRAEGKRATISFWQRIGILNDIAIIAPMIGLLGTVLGMFYAFYDINRSIESISTLFDGLGVSVGTTVAGLVVAILALILHSTAKYQLIRALATVENEAQSIATQIDDRTSIYKG